MSGSGGNGRLWMCWETQHEPASPHPASAHEGLAHAAETAYWGRGRSKVQGHMGPASTAASLFFAPMMPAFFEMAGLTEGL